jgi:hypothetical protein
VLERVSMCCYERTLSTPAHAFVTYKMRVAFALLVRTTWHASAARRT